MVPSDERTTSQVGEPEDELGGRMTFIEHLEELRSRLIRSILALAGATGVCLLFSKQIFSFLMAPAIQAMAEERQGLYFTNPTEPFLTYLKASVVAGIFLASPIILYQLWCFVAPGLYRHERRYALPFVILSTVFFVAGGGFAYLQVLPWGLQFLLRIPAPDIQHIITMREYFSFVSRILIAFAVIFELPVVAVLLARLGIITAAGMRKGRRYAVVAIFVVAAILTPPDMVTQLMMAGPLIVLYEISIIAARIVAPRPAEDAFEDS